MLDIKIGSTETLLIDVTDKLENLTDLTSAGGQFDVLNKSGAFVINGSAITVDPAQPLTAQCLVDTSGWPSGHYFLYLRFNASPDSPRLGPLEFKVNP